jgi:NAD(P)-dependent dehydrogenase (short-subunit alcohol dehydrogenase family)
MSGRLEGKTAIVTGAAGGIGDAISVRFAEEGANVIVADIDADGAARVAARITEAGGSALALTCDISSSADAKAANDLARERFSGLNVLVNNAAQWIVDGTVVDTDEADWARALAVNLTGAFLMSKYAIPLIAESGGGSVIHVASQLGQVARPGRTWYGAAKAALIHLAKVMAVDHAHQNIRVNSLSPGPILTERIVQRFGSREAAARDLADKTILKRRGRPGEIATAALFLASEESSFMTGADLLVDGGYAAQ